MQKSVYLTVLISAFLGIAIAWIDTSPGWDDTMVSVFLIFGAATFCGFMAKEKPWLIALSVSLWIPIFNLITTQNFESFMALVPGFLGAFAGWLISKTYKK